MNHLTATIAISSQLRESSGGIIYLHIEINIKNQIKRHQKISEGKGVSL
jgi:hypothetical protein